MQVESVRRPAAAWTRGGRRAGACGGGGTRLRVRRAAAGACVCGGVDSRRARASFFIFLNLCRVSHV